MPYQNSGQLIKRFMILDTVTAETRLLTGARKLEVLVDVTICKKQLLYRVSKCIIPLL